MFVLDGKREELAASRADRNLAIGARHGESGRMGEWLEVEGTRFALLTGGAERLDALIALIDGAKTSLRLLYYIFADDAAGQRVRDRLMAASARGVKVALIVDGFGSATNGDAPLFAPLKDAGANVCVFHPRWGRRFLMRNHQKLALADETHAIVGGFNVAGLYFADAGETAWRDLGLSVEGPAATHLVGYFDALAAWTSRPGARMSALRRVLRRQSETSGRVRWLHGGPLRRVSPWLAAIRADLKGARDLSIVAAYFAPTPGLLRLIDRVGRRGTARVLTAALTDNPATVGAARFTFPGLLRKRVRCFEYRPSRLHTKLYVVDDAVHLGSANFDARSLFLNLEIMLRIEDRAFADHVRRYIDGEIANARERTLDEFTGWATVPERLRNALGYFLVAVLDPGVTRRLALPAE